MPLTAKGEKILSHLQEEYGAKKGEQVLYAGKNKGTFTGIDSAMLDDADVEGARRFMDANKPGTNSPEPKYNAEAVQKAIEASRQPISPKEAKLIHALLKGRGDARLDAVAAIADAVGRIVGKVERLGARIDAYCTRQDADKSSNVKSTGRWSVKMTKDGESKRVTVSAADARSAVDKAESENPGWRGSYQHTVSA